MSTQTDRYKLTIQFVQGSSNGSYTEALHCDFKTKSKAVENGEVLVDATVRQAFVTDTLTNRVVWSYPKGSEGLTPSQM